MLRKKILFYSILNVVCHAYIFFLLLFVFFQKHFINETLEKVQDNTFNCERFSVILVLIIY